MLRFAPSPTGDIHIGNLRVAIFNYIVSKQRNEKLIIRIEDTDIERNIQGKDEEILNLLKLCGLEFYSVTYQSDNLRFHQQFASTLLEQKRAFNCFCTPEELDKKREEAKKKSMPFRYDGTCERLSDLEVLNTEKPSVIRIKKPDFDVKFTDIIRGEFSFSPEDVDSFILLRQNKKPTYNFACAIDDMLSDISLIIRGEDHLSNTPKQIAIRHALGYDKKIEYAHLPIILNNEGKKMSKRDNSSSVKWLLKQGILIEAIVNYLILLGNKVPKEIFNLNEAIQFFDLKNISKNPAKFDMDKLRFINREHLKNYDEVELAKLLNIINSNSQDKLKTVGELAKIYLEEASTLNELKFKLTPIVNKKVNKNSSQSLNQFEKEIKILDEVTKNLFEKHKSFADFKKEAMKISGLKGKNFFKPLRLFLTGAENGPELSKIYPLIRKLIIN